MKFSQFLLVTIFALATLAASAQQIPQRPNPPRLVNDFAAILSDPQERVLERKLAAFSDSTSNQIAVVTITDLDGTSISDFAAKLFDNWGIGTKGRDNGVLILVKPPKGASRGEVFIAVGYGLESVIPDAVAGRIVDYELIPLFRTGHYYAGIEKASNTLMQLAAGEFSANDYIKKRQKGVSPLFIIFLTMLILAVITKIRSRHNGEVITSSGSTSVPPIFIGGFPFMPMGGRGYSSGGFGGFTGGGGGFGGFGGGFTGGGGAGGSW
ncbi:MAG: TPM domain-containing protein [Rikenellaceae bacterium]|nr:TPM domain-containing protein [Rikenellaceae bacterium]